MVADSAVRRQAEGELEMIGSVDYRDSVRTLVADTVVYFEAEDRIVAEGRVRLTRRASGSTLEGPRVEFVRSPGGEVRRTVATGRPTMTLRREGAADTVPPVVVDADRIVMRGEEETRTRGDVRIRRPGMTARADSALFRMEEEVGELYGSPEVTGETWRLTGRTIRTRFEEGDLREVTAMEEAHARGEDFDLFADRIRARTAGEQIERLWASGEGRSVAYAPPHRLSADSLAFRFTAGEIDEMDAVRSAEAVQVGDGIPEEPLAPVALDVGDRSWVAADTLELLFRARGARDSAPPSGPDDSGADTLAAPDTLAPGDGDAPTSEGRAPAGDTAAVSLLAPTSADTALAGVYPSEPLVGEDAGDGPAADDEASRDGGREVETMRALGNARAYHVLEPDAPGERPSRHYQRGHAIVIRFEDGEARRIEGESAIGLHLDPSSQGPSGGAGEAGGAQPADTAGTGPGQGPGAPPDSAPPRDTVPADPPPPERVPPDTASVDAARRDTLSPTPPADSTRRGTPPADGTPPGAAP
jgi:hypothetical protein